jgi:hypothetical protein
LGLWSPPGKAVARFRRSEPCQAHEAVLNSGVHLGTDGSSPSSSTGESKANPISWTMVDADAKKLAGATPITGFGRLLRKH